MTNTIAAASNIVVIAQYQYCENYGAHAWDGKGACPQYWKAKGSTEKLVAQGASYAEVVGDIDAITTLASSMGTSDDYASESLIDVEIVFMHEALRTIREELEAVEDSEDAGYVAYNSTVPSMVWEHYLPQLRNHGRYYTAAEALADLDKQDAAA